MTWEVRRGDCRELMGAMDPASVDAIVCDPPYGLEFMGREWDRIGDVGKIDVRQPGDGDYLTADNPYGRSKVRHGTADSYIGKTSHQGPSEGSTDGADAFGRTRVAYFGSSNRKCRACNRWEWDHQGRKCDCEAPDFPNAQAHQARIMQAWHQAWAEEAFRVLKPGGHLLAFGGSRTFHRLACALEDAGFEIRDTVSWLYGSGFPKSMDVAKAIDRKRDDRRDVLNVTAYVARSRDAAGITNRQIDEHFGFAGMAGHWTSQKEQPTVPTPAQWEELGRFLCWQPDPAMEALVARLNGRKGQPGEDWHRRPVLGTVEKYDTSKLRAGFTGAAYNDPEHLGATREVAITAAASEDAQRWQGWGTALKPGWEPCVVARKPTQGTVAANVLRHGVGGMNIDGCRIGDDPLAAHGGGRNGSGRVYGNGAGVPAIAPGANPHNGRWPVNVCLDEDAAAELDAQAGERGGGYGVRGGGGQTYGSNRTFQGDLRTVGYGDKGGPSRFFFTAPSTIGACDHANGVAPTSSQEGQPAGIAPSGAATSGNPVGAPSSASPERTTSDTGSASDPSDASGTPTTRSTEEKCLLGSVPTNGSSPSRASDAGNQTRTDTTMTTASPSTSDSSAENATLPSTPPNSEPGASDFAGARFMYCAKASTAERNAGLADLPERENADWPQNLDGEDARGAKPRANHHPTVKPVALMRWLCRLVTPPGGLILDPFAGSGTTGVAAVSEGFDFVGCEMEPEYATIAERRIAHAAERATAAKPDDGQLAMFG